MNTPQKSLAERITPHKVVAAENDPRFLYALNEDRTNVFDVSIRRGFQTQGRDKDKWERTSDDELDANAELIAEAFNVTHETGKTPRELADMLKATVERFDIFLKEYAREHSTDHKGFTDWKLNRLNS